MCQVHFSRAVLNNIPNRDKEEVAEKLRQGFEDESKMAELAVELRQKRYSKSAEQLTGLVRTSVITGLFQRALEED